MKFPALPLLMIGVLATATMPQAQAEEPTLSAQLESEIKAPRTPTAAQTLGLGERPGISFIPLDSPEAPQDIVIRPDDESDPLPNIWMGPLKLSRATLEEALRFVLWGTDISISIQPGINGVDTSGQGGASMVGLKGSLRDVLEEVSLAYGFHYIYNAHRNSLRILPDRNYVMELPPVEVVAESMTSTMQNLGAGDVFYNKALGLISYRATKGTSQKIEAYLKKVNSEQSQILYEVSIIEVRLNHGSQYGIQWNKLGWQSGSDSIGLTSTGSKLAGGLGIGLSFSVGSFAMDSLLLFLRTQGAVKIANQPLMPILSGGSAKMSVGDTVNYISQVATTAIGNTTTSQNSATTSSLKTGTDLEISGRYRDGTVYTSVKLRLSELIELKSVSTGGNTVQLPHTSDRDFSSPALRIRPGEAMLLGGIITARQSTAEDAPDIPFFGKLLASNRSQLSERSELVVVVRPTVMVFKRGLAQ